MKYYKICTWKNKKSNCKWRNYEIKLSFLVINIESKLMERLLRCHRCEDGFKPTKRQKRPTKASVDILKQYDLFIIISILQTTIGYNTASFTTRSLRGLPSIAFSIARWLILTLWTYRTVSVYVSSWRGGHFNLSLSTMGSNMRKHFVTYQILSKTNWILIYSPRPWSYFYTIGISTCASGNTVLKQLRGRTVYRDRIHVH